MVDFNNLLSRFVLAAPRALNDEVAQGQMVVCTQMSMAGSAASFTVKIMNAGTGRDLAEQLAQPLIKGLLGLTASAAELAAALSSEAEALEALEGIPTLRSLAAKLRVALGEMCQQKSRDGGWPLPGGWLADEIKSAHRRLGCLC